MRCRRWRASGGIPAYLADRLLPAWKAQVPYLAGRFRVITIDPRGNGRSDRPRSAAAYAETELIADTVVVMDACGVDRAVRSRGRGSHSSAAARSGYQIEDCPSHSFGPAPYEIGLDHSLTTTSRDNLPFGPFHTLTTARSATINRYLTRCGIQEAGVPNPRSSTSQIFSNTYPPPGPADNPSTCSACLAVLRWRLEDPVLVHGV